MANNPADLRIVSYESETVRGKPVLVSGTMEFGGATYAFEARPASDLFQPVPDDETLTVQDKGMSTVCDILASCDRSLSVESTITRAIVSALRYAGIVNAGSARAALRRVTGISRKNDSLRVQEWNRTFDVAWNRVEAQLDH